MIAQPSLQHPQNAPEVGDVVEIQFVSSANLTHEPTGADVSWDFSQLTNIMEPGLITAISPTEAPAGNEFPMANIVLNMNDSIYSYLMVEETAAYYLGVQTTVAGFPVLFIYDDSRKYLEYPFNYGDSFADTYHGMSLISFGEVRASANTSVVADSYGTLILPTGTYSDILRTTTIDNETDSIFVNGVFSSVIYLSRTQYAWYTSSSFGPILSMEILNLSGVIDTTCYYTNDESGVRERGKHLISDFSVFPNPAEDHLFVEFVSYGWQDVAIVIVNQVGQVMISKTTSATGTINEKFDIRSLPSGIYFANISCKENNQITQKFIIR